LYASWNNAKDIPWNGGTATSANCECTVIAYYSNGTTGNVTNSSIIEGSKVVQESSEGERHSAGTLRLTARYEGLTDTVDVTVMQSGKEKRNPSFTEIDLEQFPYNGQ
jgi:hypothetical protein